MQVSCQPRYVGRYKRDVLIDLCIVRMYMFTKFDMYTCAYMYSRDTSTVFK